MVYKNPIIRVALHICWHYSLETLDTMIKLWVIVNKHSESSWLAWPPSSVLTHLENPLHFLLVHVHCTHSSSSREQQFSLLQICLKVQCVDSARCDAATTPRILSFQNSSKPLRGLLCHVQPDLSLKTRPSEDRSLNFPCRQSRVRLFPPPDVAGGRSGAVRNCPHLEWAGPAWSWQQNFHSQK